MKKKTFGFHASSWINTLMIVIALVAIGLVVFRARQHKTTPAAAAGGDVLAVAQARGLTPDDVLAAVKTYTPSGKLDDYVMFSSGGHSGQVYAIGLPSMRLLKSIAVFTPEPWQGWGYGALESMETLAGGDYQGKPLTWGDTHHPALSETDGDYDGEFLFVNDKGNARIATISLKDFETKQIIKNPLVLNDHGGTMVTPDTEWVIEGGQYAAPLDGNYQSMDDYADAYRGLVTLWKFDRKAGKIDPARSFAIELPPYWQDLFDAGKGVSKGWIFGNSFNTEMSTGGTLEKQPPFEAGASQRDMDYLHIIDLEKAVKVAEAGQTETIQGFKVISLKTAVEEGLLFFAPEPKSPHGVDVTPGGEYIVISGKLDPHVTVYSFEKIRQAIAAGPTEKDAYGVPILDFDQVKEAQIEVGLGPLHTQFDDKGYAYTSLFLDSAVARWSLGGPYAEKHPEEGWTLVGTIPVHYNVGHISCAEGDTASPDGKYLVSMNKWSVDRFANVGPLLPQNFQLIDIEQPGQTMQLLYDMPIGFGEPHYAQICKADKLHPFEVYPEVGYNPHTGAKDPYTTMPGQEKVVRQGTTVEIWSTVVRSHFTPDRVEVKRGERVIWHLTNIEQAKDATHGFAIAGYNINLSLEPGEASTIDFVADTPGVYPFYCTEFCSALHLEMMGYLLVKP
ncbi:MAG: Sec-dependent nitrous-oxide reductase [Vulcanimicrobiota bacterium]